MCRKEVNEKKAVKEDMRGGGLRRRHYHSTGNFGGGFSWIA
jgi:hypothetical protein